MQSIWSAAIARRYASVIDGFERVIRDCPPDLWETSAWEVRKDEPYVWPVRRAGGKYEDEATQEQLLQVHSAFWNVAYHALFHIDFYLSGGEVPFKAPRPFKEADHRGNTVPARTYTPDELLAYAGYNRAKAAKVLGGLSDEDAEKMLQRMGQPFAELIVHNLLHANEHLGQLSLFLGQHKVGSNARAARAQQTQMLRDRVRDRSDEEVDAFVGSVGGYARLLPLVFAGIAAAIGPQPAAAVRWEVGSKYLVRMAEKGTTFEKRAAGAVDGTVTMSGADLLRLVTGDLDFAAASGDGRIRMAGDQAVLMRMFAAMAPRR